MSWKVHIGLEVSWKKIDKMVHLGHFWAIFSPKMAIYEPQWAKIDPHFQKISVFTAKSFSPKLFGYCNPILGHAPGHWDALIWRNCENGSNICPKMAKNGQKWPFLMRQCLFTCKLFSTKVPGHHSLIPGQHSRHSDALIRHICENGSQFWPLGAYIWPFWDPKWPKNGQKWSMLSKQISWYC